ncbi:MAG: Maf family protein [Alphaproteobacteria bacterium]|nr:Maf family protein [Alphaproteobacteria bacterium]
MTALVLASASKARSQMLRNAGIEFAVQPARVDEAAIKEGMQADGAPPVDAAQALADLKAMRVSPDDADTLVIGADQILECDGVWFDKPETLEDARNQLKTLSGRTHHLHTAASVVKEGAVIWREATNVSLTMRALTTSFITDYLEAEGDTVLQSVGAYQIEGRGAQLFAGLRGDFFSVLGLPLLPLLGFLRNHGVVPA